MGGGRYEVGGGRCGVGGMRDDGGAVFSECGRYRYGLWRVWDEGGASVLFVGLNPSTADGGRDDATVRRCVGFARDWGYGGVWVANLFGWRATRPAELRRAADPVGRANDAWLRRLAEDAGIIVTAWGNHGTWQQRDEVVLSLLPRPRHHLGLTRHGQPRHPLYLPAATPLCLWEERGMPA